MQWSSISIKKGVRDRFVEFCDRYNIADRNEGLNLLLNLVDLVERNSDIEAGDQDQLLGFVVGGGDENPPTVATTSGDEVVVISDITEEVETAQPLETTSLTAGDVYCPGCGEGLFSYGISHTYPSVSSGVFDDVIVHCSECGENRPIYTLVAAPESFDKDDVEFKMLLLYWGYTLVKNPLSFDEFKDRALNCEQAARDAGFPWLPNPSLWIGFSINEDGSNPITLEDYMQFIAGYIRVIWESTSDVNVLGRTIMDDKDMTCCSRNEAHIHFNLDFTLEDACEERVNDVTANWNDVSCEIEPVMDDNHDVVVVFDGLFNHAV